jgi:glycyl-tRNA synthetase beta chain
VKNILKKQDALYEVDPSLFKEACESRLWESYASIKDEIEACIENGHFYDALELLSGLREPVDAFFEGVEVLTKEDAALRQNRVGVLQHAAGLLGRVADFSKFSI